MIHLYQSRSAGRPHRCLYYPSCSSYAILAYQKNSFIRASILTIQRIRDCNPFSSRPYIDYP
ncbi:MAG TPA: membrane protein insertion efficiency factor YidD [Methanoregulaceae archaeon]|nr:membrane protein insertion efficiency factor YidD [Methanoregulaceae archaeon]